jgi:uncharacterized RDD family membrane protein YckC
MQFETETNNQGTYEVQAYGSISRRFVAFLLDILILIIPCAILGSAIPVIGGAIMWFFYGPILESSAIRATIGKHMMGLQVADLSGRRISLRAATIRNVMKLVSGALLLIGFVFALFTKRKQSLHDLLADTIVVYGRSEEAIADAWVDSVKTTFRSAQEAAKPLMPQTSAHSTLEQLERLQKLREQGALTEEEFIAEKKKLL